MQRRRTWITRSAAARPGNVHSCRCSHFRQAQPIQGHRSLACVAVPDRSPLRLALRRPAPAGPGRAHVKWGRAGTRPCIARPTSRPRRGDPFESTVHRDPVHFYFSTEHGSRLVVVASSSPVSHTLYFNLWNKLARDRPIVRPID